MLNENLKKHLSDHLDQNITNTAALTGGDINDVYKIDTVTKSFVVKVNDATAFPNMFELEKLGLEELAKTKTFRIPEVLHTGTFEDQSFLILEYIDAAPKAETFDQSFGEQLAAMHRNTAAFGFVKDNYIGSLPQANTEEPDAVSFYINQRLEPQFKMARERGYSFEKLDPFYKNIESLIPREPAALIHGDLWSGNYMVSEAGKPALIDPATCYAPREMDLALMQLFGGFSSLTFEAYNSSHPLTQDWESRIKLWQLYYILVHVNLFGGPYYASAKAILKQYL
ncbi:fructosamine kinase family protein [Leeuwenhoekiella sp. H156]|uniref:fructosamine kinase family protein n=1 Tax=Leeuwenhoekiella sp. H156 TaxID=3450128 RepID=UPI003FA471C7